MSAEKKTTVDQEYLRNLEKKVEDLRTLMDVSAIISSTIDFTELMNVVMEKIKDVMNAEACSVLLYNRTTKKLEFEVALCEKELSSDILKQKITLSLGQGIAGCVAESQEPLIIEDVQQDDRFNKEADKMTGFETKCLMAAPLVGRNGLIAVAEIMNPRGKDSFSQYDLEIFQTLCRQIAIAIENALFHKEHVESERHRRELELAAALQKSFLPDSPVLRKDNIVISAVNISAKEVGGDLYDFIEHTDGRVGVLIGDISGKGVSAALYMAKIISDFRYIARQSDIPHKVLETLNTLLYRAPRGLFLTAIYMITDTTTGALNVSVAGHPPFLLISSGDVRAVDLQAGPPLGVMEGDYLTENLSMKSGDRLLLLTDGVFEAKNRAAKRLGFDNFLSFVKDHMNEEKLLDKITEYIITFSDNKERADDLTLVEVRLL